MLKQRVITALLLLAVLLPALFYPDPAPFCGVALVLMAAAAWEWARLNGVSGTGAVVVGAACVVLCGATWLLGGLEDDLTLLWSLAGGAWVLVGAWLLRGGVAGWPKVPQAVRLVGGVLALWLAWLAVSQARVVGINYLLSVLVLVWVADIFAYFAGRALGRRKLAPTISPGKSWEGVWGGMAGVVLLALAWVWADNHWNATVASFYSRLSAHGVLLLLAAVVFMAAMSVVGDLVESLIKRSAGVKDSSGLLPGHGGVLDRVDALLPTLPLALMLTTQIAR